MASRHAFCFASPPRVYAQPSGRSQSAKLCQTSTRTPSKHFSQPPARLLRNSTSGGAAAAARTRHLPGGGRARSRCDRAERRGGEAEGAGESPAPRPIPAPSPPHPAPSPHRPAGSAPPPPPGRTSPGGQTLPSALGARPPHSPPLAAPCPRRDAAVTAPSLSPSLLRRAEAPRPRCPRRPPRASPAPGITRPPLPGSRRSIRNAAAAALSSFSCLCSSARPGRAPAPCPAGAGLRDCGIAGCLRTRAGPTGTAPAPTAGQPRPVPSGA